jgi:hypothetical protein
MAVESLGVERSLTPVPIKGCRHKPAGRMDGLLMPMPCARCPQAWISSVHSFLVNRDRWTRKLRFRERADRNRDEAFKAFCRVVHRRSALRTEPESAVPSFVSDPDELLARALDRDRRRREASLSSKDTSSPALAGQAMTDRDPNRVGCDMSLKLATTAGGGSMSHRRVGQGLRTTFLMRVGKVSPRVRGRLLRCCARPDQ